jgi:hypothetical protein
MDTKLVSVLLIIAIIYFLGIFAAALDIKRNIKRNGEAKLSFLDFTVIEKSSFKK